MEIKNNKVIENLAEIKEKIQGTMFLLLKEGLDEGSAEIELILRTQEMIHSFNQKDFEVKNVPKVTASPETFLHDLDLSPRVFALLRYGKIIRYASPDRRAGLITIDDVLEFHDYYSDLYRYGIFSGLFSIKGFGKAAYLEVEKVLSEVGVELPRFSSETGHHQVKGKLTNREPFRTFSK